LSWRPPSAAIFAGVYFGNLSRHSFFFRGRGGGKKIVRTGFQKHSGFEKFAAEDEPTPDGDFGCAGQFDAIGENHADSGGAGTARSSGAVGVNRVFIRQIEADHVAHRGDVQTSGAEVACDEIADFALRKAFQGDTTGFFFHGSVNGGDGKTVRGESLGRSGNAARLRNEHETAFGTNGGLDASDEIEALSTVAVETPVLDVAGEDGVFVDRNLGGIMKKGANLASYAFGQRGRNEYARAFFRSRLDQCHGERHRFARHHSVGLVENEIAQTARSYLAQGYQVRKAAECPDDDVRTVAQFRYLLIESGAAENDGGSHAQARSRDETVGFAPYLHRQFLRRRRDDHAGLCRARASGFRDHLHRGGEVRESLACARLRLDESVAVIEHERHRDLLYGGRAFETEGGEGLGDGLGKAESDEFVHGLSSHGRALRHKHDNLSRLRGVSWSLKRRRAFGYSPAK
jgi:hypothetical protein